MTVRLFARLREVVGAADVEVVLAEGARVRDAWDALAGRFTGLGAYAGSVSCAVNDDYARMNAPLKEGDQVAFLPPVSGG